MVELKKVNLGDIITFKNGKKKPAEEGTIPIYGGNGILGYTDRSNYKNCIAVGRVGAYCGSVYYEPGECWISDNAIAATPKADVDIYFAFYLLKSLNLNQRHIGTSQPLLTQEILNKIECQIPDLDIQKKISNILRTMDGKVECNTAINRNLLEQSFTIFHSMFDEKICESDMVEFGNVASFKYGTMPKKDKICEEGYPLFSGYKIVGYYPEKMFDEPQLIIVARGVGGTGDIKYTPENCYLTNLAIAIMANKKLYEEYLYHYLMCQDMKILNTGSAQPQITVSSLEKYKLYYPDEKAAKEFSDIVIPIRDRIRENRKENQKLEELRDRLLPKLMSGELDVSDLDI